MLFNNYQNYESHLEKDRCMELNFKMVGLKMGTYRIKKYYLSTQSGSAYEYWINMNKPSRIDNEIFDYLKSKEKMNIIFEERLIEHEILIKEVVNINEIVLYCFEICQ